MVLSFDISNLFFLTEFTGIGLQRYRKQENQSLRQKFNSFENFLACLSKKKKSLTEISNQTKKQIYLTIETN